MAKGHSKGPMVAIVASVIVGSISTGAASEYELKRKSLDELFAEYPVFCLKPDNKGGCEGIVGIGSIVDGGGFETTQIAYRLNGEINIILSIRLEFEIAGESKCYTHVQRDIRYIQVFIADSFQDDRLLSKAPIEVRDLYRKHFAEGFADKSDSDDNCAFYTVLEKAGEEPVFRRYEYVNNKEYSEYMEFDAYKLSGLKALYLIPEEIDP